MLPQKLVTLCGPSLLVTSMFAKLLSYLKCHNTTLFNVAKAKTNNVFLIAILDEGNPNR